MNPLRQPEEEGSRSNKAQSRRECLKMPSIRHSTETECPGKTDVGKKETPEARRLLPQKQMLSAPKKPTSLPTFCFLFPHIAVFKTCFFGIHHGQAKLKRFMSPLGIRVEDFDKKQRVKIISFDRLIKMK